MKRNIEGLGCGRHFWGLILCLFFLTTVQAQEKYVIKGHIKGLKKDMKLLLQFVGRDIVTGQNLTDSTIVKGGRFYLEGTIDRPHKISLSLRSMEPEPQSGMAGYQLFATRDGQTFYLAPGTTVMEANSLKEAVISNQTQKEYLDLENQLKPAEDLMDTISKQFYGTRNKDSVKIFGSKMRAYYKQLDSVKEDFVGKNPNSYVSLDIVIDHFHVIEDPVAFEALFNTLSPFLKNSASGKKMLIALALTKRLAIGQPAIDFTQNDTDGKPVSLASLRGKYVLIDFWASWCGPCRTEFPYLHKAYDQFKGNNFEIIGVSLDENRSAWLNSIKENNFPWLEVCDMKGHLNEVVLAYGINAIPQSFLIDPQGTIIAKNLRGNDLSQKLKEVIKPSAPSDTFTIKANVVGMPASTKVYLSYQVPGRFVIDSAAMDNGSFVFSGMIPYPLKAQLLLDHDGVGLTRLGPDPDALTLYLDKGEIDIHSTDSIKNSVITGSRINAEYTKYKAFIAVPVKEMALISAEEAAAPAVKKKDQQFLNDLRSRFQKASEDKIAFQYQYIKLNPNSEFSLGALHEIAGANIDVARIEPLYNSLSATIRNTVAGKEFARSMEVARTTSVGAMDPVFTQNDVNDKPVSLADFRGKYVLLDFWASWCGPCRMENPNLVKAYTQFKDKNFEILGVSLDSKKEAWVAAIKADKTPWVHVSDLKGWQNEVALEYGITAVPQNFLIDPNGIIIAKNLRGETLEKKLSELFDIKN
jgi:peroxiredoxin